MIVTKYKYYKSFLFLFSIITALSYLSCSGKSSLSSPQLYGNHPKSEKDSVSDTSETVEKGDIETAESSNKPLIDIIFGNKSSSKSKDGKDKPKKTDSLDAETDTKGALLNHRRHSSNSIENIFYSTVDIADSASAVDDDLWRQFDLAEEYYAMGVIANREASWEEAQYYFEKSLNILANLDVETDSSLTPEATKYSSILENIIADYRITLRSLGNLTEDVSSAVLIERFGNLASKLGSDSLLVFKDGGPRVTFDIPIVMNDRVKRSIVYFQTVARDAFYKYLRRSKKYTPMMKRILSEYGLPNDLIYLSLVESGFNPHAYSWARAMGLWQFISSTGRLYKLKRNWWIDERKDPIKSTHAACRFLKDLYSRFGSWELAMAAYNGGPGRVSKVIKKQKTIDFWKMKLRRQTMDYVPLIMAAAIIAKNPYKYGFYDIEFEGEVVWDEVVVDKCLELSVVAKEIGCSVKELKKLNPELLRKYTPPNSKKYVLKIPKGKKKKFLAAYDKMPSPKETSWVRHKIKRGETVSTIAAKYGVSQYAIFEANNLRRRSRIYAGKSLIVPVPLDREYSRSKRKKNKNYQSKNSIYVIRAGDTMWDIARAFGTSVSALRRVNYIERGSRIYVGQKLKIPSSAKKFKNKNIIDSRSSSTYASTNSKSSKKTKTESNKSVKSYKVRSGDTLWDIARKFGTTTGKIRRFNGLGRSSRIYPGQLLKIVADDIKYIIHKVRRGETLGAIAKKYRTTTARIRAVNSIDNPDRLQIGEKLKIYIN